MLIILCDFFSLSIYEFTLFTIMILLYIYIAFCDSVTVWKYE